MIPDDEAAAVAAALTLFVQQETAPVPPPLATKRWRLASRYPELELEEIRALH